MDWVPWVACFALRKVSKETHPAQWVGLKALNKSGGGWVKIKAHGLRSMGCLFLIDENEKG
jgi:hypothetical protein